MARGISAEFAEKYPNLEAMHFCAGIGLTCQIRQNLAQDKEDPNQTICTAMPKSGISTSKPIKDGGYEVTNIYPEPEQTCATCPVAANNASAAPSEAAPSAASPAA